jgi:uncharacterized membrane protein HdeD (DUF308 family)
VLGWLFVANPGGAAVAVAWLIGLVAVAWGIVFVVLAIAARSATKNLPDGPTAPPLIPGSTVA